VATSDAIEQGAEVTLTCSMSYYYKSAGARSSLLGGRRAEMTAALGWSVTVGLKPQTAVSYTLLNDSDHQPIGQTLTAEVATRRLRLVRLNE